MNNPVETIKVSESAKDQLVRLKRRTGIANWNILCRWALCVSLSETNKPPTTKIEGFSNIEIPWRIFGGEYADAYTAAMIQRCIDDGYDSGAETVAEQFKLHLHRGIGYLANDQDVRTVDGLINKL